MKRRLEINKRSKISRILAHKIRIILFKVSIKIYLSNECKAINDKSKKQFIFQIINLIV